MEKHGAGKRLIVTADDFGLSEAVNEAVERGHRDGILTAASLMVAAPATADAVRRARTMPSLAVGLHVVVIEGPSVLGPEALPELVDAAGRFPSNQLRLGLAYFFRPRARQQLATEIRAQFAAFADTGLRLDHANAHKHMHLHPTVGRLMIGIGREYGLRAIRVPAEPLSLEAFHENGKRLNFARSWPGLARPPMTSLAAAKDVGARAKPGHDGLRARFADGALFAWSRLLRRQAHRAGLVTNDHCFGLRWTGAMTRERLLRLSRTLPEGVSEIYLHPAAWRDERLLALMPDYAHEAELAALLAPEVGAALTGAGVARIGGFAAIHAHGPTS